MTHSDQEGIAPVSPPSPANPLRDLIWRLAESAIIAYDNHRHELGDDHARAYTMLELDDSLDTYGIVAAYPELLEAARVLLQLWDRPWSVVALSDKAEAARQALALSEKSVVGDVAEGTAETPEDAPL